MATSSASRWPSSNIWKKRIRKRRCCRLDPAGRARVRCAGADRCGRYASTRQPARAEIPDQGTRAAGRGQTRMAAALAAYRHGGVGGLAGQRPAHRSLLPRRYADAGRLLPGAASVWCAALWRRHDAISDDGSASTPPAANCLPSSKPIPPSSRTPNSRASSRYVRHGTYRSLSTVPACRLLVSGTSHHDFWRLSVPAAQTAKGLF